MAEHNEISLTDWDICMPLVSDAGHNAVFRMKNLPDDA
jgi:hypothetical protein